MQNTIIARPLRRARPARLALACALALAASAAGVAPAWAQTTAAAGAEPEPGMWAFDGEQNGKPGRGLQIDTQEGQGMVVSYVGYRSNGSSLFLQASGLRPAGSTAFTGTLQEFRNGPVIGGSSGNGEPAASLGTIQLSFDTPTSGTVTLPGDVPRRISRLTYQTLWNEQFRSDFILAAFAQPQPITVQNYDIQLSQGTFRLRQQTTSDGSLCTYSGPYQSRGAGVESEGTRICTDANGTQRSSTFRAERFAIDSYGIFTGTLRSGDSTTYLVGPCRAGAVFLDSPLTCATVRRSYAVVQPGMWSFDDELDGRPGRSLQIDTQDGSRTMFISYLGYRPDGSSMFLQGVTPDRAAATRYSVILKEYRNGPAIGGPAASGEEASTVGEAQLDFDSPTTGTIKLPFESTPRRISRYRYEDHTERFNRAFAAYVYPFGNYEGLRTLLDIAARSDVFQMKATPTTGNYCEYKGTYRLAGNGLASEGTRTCFSDGGTTTTDTPYRITDLTVDRNGLLRGRIEEAEGTRLVTGR